MASPTRTDAPADPAGVTAARALAAELDFGNSCSVGAARLFAADPAVTVLHAEWTVLRDHAPFALLFLDGGGKQDGPDAVAELVAPGGIVVMDDFTPSDGWPPRFAGRPDALRVAWLTDPRFASVEVRVSPTESAILATRRPG